DGNKMAAVKGSEFSQCVGDEAGTAGGVVSNTNRKEAKWILCSFDVKLEGKGACRLGDKMTMNHGNTACMSGVLNPPVPRVRRGVVKLNCKPKWTDCQKQQMKAKADRMNAIAQEKGHLESRPTKGRIRRLASSWARKFADDWNEPNPTGWPDFANPAKQ